jgi:hypothetical protein
MTIPYDADLYVITSWNGAGTPIVFSSKESCEALLSAYDKLKAESNAPWVYDRAAISGDRVLDLFNNGLLPWKVYLSQELEVISCRSIPLHHIALRLVVERYDSGAPRTLEVWAANKDFALVHTRNMLTTSDRVKLLHDMDEEWALDHWLKEQGYKKSVPAPAPPQGLQDEVDFFSDEQKDKAAELLQKETAGHQPRHGVREEPSKPHPVPQPQVNIPGFGTVINLNAL